MRMALATLLLTLLLDVTRAITENVSIPVNGQTSSPNRTGSPTLNDMPYISSIVKVPEGYNHLHPPTEGGHVDMNCSVIILSFETLGHRDMGFDIDFVLACQWRDPRLVPEGSANKTGSSFIDETSLKLWRPSIETSVLSKGVSKRDFFRPVLYNHELVILAQKFSLHQACLMDLRNYPHDRQCCAVSLVTYGGVKALWNEPMYWVPNSSVVATLMSTVRSDFLIDGISFVSYMGSYFDPGDACVYQRGFCDYMGSDACTRMKCTDADNLNRPECIRCNHFGGNCEAPTLKDCPNGGLSTWNQASSTNLEFKLLLRRHAEYGVIYAYIPTSGIVVLAWLSFWLDPHSAPARTGLGVTTVLTMISMNIRSSAAELGYIRAIDIWLFTCKNFVCFALLEYALVNFLVTTSIPAPKDVQPEMEAEHINGDLLCNREKGFKSLLGENKNKRGVGNFDDDADFKNRKKTHNIRKGSFSDDNKPPPKPTKTRQDYAEQLDMICRIGYPIMFSLFVVGYGVFVSIRKWVDYC